MSKCYDTDPVKTASPDLLAALESAAKLIPIARHYFPKSMHNSDKFTLELTCAEISKAIATATEQPIAPPAAPTKKPVDMEDEAWDGFLAGFASPLDDGHAYWRDVDGVIYGAPMNADGTVDLYCACHVDDFDQLLTLAQTTTVLDAIHTARAKNSPAKPESFDNAQALSEGRTIWNSDGSKPCLICAPA